ncbi:MAG TPA: hypothetical protein VGB75_05600 [Jatrophihabitans sp.]|jgi:hypothetical protein|uniref:hypothetical protein n=1 Tax=Jatrophihabitans sp. TaxID=1932789 RepID=UPI002F234833
MIALLALAVSVSIVAANVAMVAVFVLRWDRRAADPDAADGRAAASHNAEPPTGALAS